MTDSRTQINIRITEEDAALRARLERAYGLNTAGITRMAWRYLAEFGAMRHLTSVPDDKNDPDPEHDALHAPHCPDEACGKCRQAGWV